MTRPPHLFRGGRDLVTSFEQHTKLYCRHAGKFSSTPFGSLQLRFPNLSVTRDGLNAENCPDDARWSTELETFSKPPFYHADAQVIGFAVSAVPQTRSPENSPRVFRFTVEHAPYNDLYPHCEIRVRYDGQSDTIEAQNDIPSSVKKFVRQAIADAIIAGGTTFPPEPT